ncbi:MAG: DMT family transporter [Anaerolineae bacterium]|nr:DMT family transporter [Anaerolineae bacterium]
MTAVAISRTRLLVGLVLGIVAISFGSIFVRFAQAAGAPPLSIAAWRLIVASAVMVPYAWLTHRDEIRSLSRRELGLMLVSGVFLALHFATWISSLAYTSVASSVVLVSMGPLFVGLGSWLFLHERPGLTLIVGIVMAAVGSIVISGGDLGKGQDHLLGDLLALTGAVMVAGYLMIGRKVRARRSLVTYIALVYGAAMVTLLVMVLAARQPMIGFSPAAYGWMLALGLIPQLTGHSTLNWALRHLSATYVSIVTLAEPLSAGLLAYIILGEAVSWSTAAGGALILAGIYIASRAELE